MICELKIYNEMGGGWINNRSNLFPHFCADNQEKKGLFKMKTKNENEKEKEQKLHKRKFNKCNK